MASNELSLDELAVLRWMRMGEKDREGSEIGPPRHALKRLARKLAGRQQLSAPLMAYSSEIASWY